MGHMKADEGGGDGMKSGLKWTDAFQIQIHWQ